MRRVASALVVLSLIGPQGCSSKPRAFVPELAAPPADQAAFEQKLAICQEAAAPLGSKKTADKATAAAGTAVVGGTAASGAAWGAAAAAGGAAIVAVPVVGVVWGVSRINRSNKESKIKHATEACLSEHGYTVAGWQKVKVAKAPKEQPPDIQ